MGWKITNLEGMRPLQQMIQNVPSKGVTHLTPQGIQLDVIYWIATDSKAKCTQWVAVMEDNMEEMEFHKLLMGDFLYCRYEDKILLHVAASLAFYKLLQPSISLPTFTLNFTEWSGWYIIPKISLFISSYNTSYLSKSLEKSLERASERGYIW